MTRRTLTLLIPQVFRTPAEWAEAQRNQEAERRYEKAQERAGRYEHEEFAKRCQEAVREWNVLSDKVAEVWDARQADKTQKAFEKVFENELWITTTKLKAK